MMVMSDPYTPTTAHIHDYYIAGAPFKDEAEQRWVTWLAAHDAQVRAEAWDEGAKWMREQAARLADKGSQVVLLDGTKRRSAGSSHAVSIATNIRTLPTSPPPTEDAETKHKNDVRAVKVAELRQMRVTVEANQSALSPDNEEQK